MRILLLGDASAYHATLAKGLVALGHDVTVASHGSNWMDTERSINLRRRAGRLGGALLWLKLNALASSQLLGYDVVQMVGPFFVQLRPNRMRQVFDRIRSGNRNVFVSMLASDSYYVDACANSKILRYSEWAIDGVPSKHAIEHKRTLDEWLSPELRDYTRHIYDNVDGVTTALYEYHKVCQRFVEPDRLAYCGIPIETQAVEHAPLSLDGKVNIMLCCHRGREIEKGADRFLPVIEEVVRRNADKAAFDFVQNVPYAEFQHLLNQAHIVVDQLYSYTPATTALMAMARGKVTVSGAEPEFYDFIGEKDRGLIINPDPMDINHLASDLQRVIDNRHLLAEMGRESREFVVKHNDMMVVAQRFVDFWERRMK